MARSNITCSGPAGTCRGGPDLDIITQTKHCGGCNQELPLEGFYRNKVKSDGLQNQCKSCLSAYGKQDRAKRFATEEQRRERSAYQQQWVDRHPGYRAAVYKRHYAKHRDRIIARYVYRNAVRKALKANSSHVPFTEEQFTAKMAYWGNRCWACGGRFEAVDHVKPLAKGGPHVLANLRPICKPCNSSKGDKWPLGLALFAARKTGPADCPPAASPSIVLH